MSTNRKNSLSKHPNYHLGPVVGGICDSLSIDVTEQAVAFNLSLFPNPFAGAFSLSFTPLPSPCVLHIHGINGRLVYHAGVAPWSQLKQLALDLPAGVYLCIQRFGSKVAVNSFVPGN